MRADLVVLGKGVVGGALAELVAAGRAPRGVRLVRTLDTRSAPLSDAALDAHAASSSCPVLVDATPADGLEALYARALARGIHVVTANKKPLVAPFSVREELFTLARRAGVVIGREATVGAGLPVVDTLRALAASGDRVRRIECVLSGTLAFLCAQLHAGTPMSDAIAVAKARGYTEPNPREDLAGADVAKKAVIVAREMGFPIELADVDLVPFIGRDEPIDDVAWARRARDAQARGERFVYLAQIEVDGEALRASVGLASVREDSAVAAARGPAAVAAFETERRGAEPLVVRGPGAGGVVTAEALLRDVERASSSVRPRAGTRRAGIQGSCATGSASASSSASSFASTRAGCSSSRW